MEEMAKKRVKDSETEQSYLLMHRHINGYGRLFGGQLVAWIDELAGLVGRRHCGHEITTACIDNLNFKHPAFLNDTVVLVGRVTYVGRTSMEVRVDTYVEELATGIRKMINRAYVVMVAIDENGRALPVPGLILESPEQEAEWEGGKRRYADGCKSERNNILQPRKPARPRFGSLRKDGRNFRPLSEKKQQPATQAALNQTGAQKAQLHFPQNSPYATNAAGQKNRKLSRRQNFCRSF